MVRGAVAGVVSGVWGCRGCGAKVSGVGSGVLLQIKLSEGDKTVGKWRGKTVCEDDRTMTNGEGK